MPRKYEIKVSKRRCRVCHINQNATEFLVGEVLKQICKTCRRDDEEQEMRDRRNARRRERAALAREIKKEAEYKARILTYPMHKLRHTVDVINETLTEYNTPSIEMPPAVETAREVLEQNRTFRAIYREYLSLTRVNRAHLLRLNHIKNDRKERTPMITLEAIQRRQRLQNIAVEALKMSLDEYLSGQTVHIVNDHYADLVTIYRPI